MYIIHNIAEWQAIRRALSPEQTLGFVPTMGALHAGHAALIQQSLNENMLTVVSIFVNPTQFNRPDDLTLYPRTLKEDTTLLETLGVDYVLMPEASMLYADDFQYQVHIALATPQMEAKCRPGHFTGVLTVVMKLLNIVQPTQLYLGEKDYQQYHFIKGMAEAFFMPVKVKGCETIREPSQLPLSSRNQRLHGESRGLADAFARIFHSALSPEMIEIELTALGITVEYIESYEQRLFIAVQIADVRLIDNRPIS